MISRDPSFYIYPSASTGRENRVYIDCKCGFRSWGQFFGRVDSGDANDVWYQHRLHMDTACKPLRILRTDSRKLRLEEAISEMRKILERVDV